MKNKATKGTVFWCPLYGATIPETGEQCGWTGGSTAGPGSSQHMKRWHKQEYPEWSDQEKSDRMAYAKLPPDQRMTDWRGNPIGSRTATSRTATSGTTAPGTTRRGRTAAPLNRAGRGKLPGRSRTDSFIDNIGIQVEAPAPAVIESPVDLQRRVVDIIEQNLAEIERQIADTRRLEAEARSLRADLQSAQSTLATMTSKDRYVTTPATPATSQANVNQTPTTEIHAAPEPELQHQHA